MDAGPFARPGRVPRRLVLRRGIGGKMRRPAPALHAYQALIRWRGCSMPRPTPSTTAQAPSEGVNAAMPKLPSLSACAPQVAKSWPVAGSSTSTVWPGARSVVGVGPSSTPFERCTSTPHTGDRGAGDVGRRADETPGGDVVAQIETHALARHPEGVSRAVPRVGFLAGASSHARCTSRRSFERIALSACQLGVHLLAAVEIHGDFAEWFCRPACRPPRPPPGRDPPPDRLRHPPPPCRVPGRSPAAPGARPRPAPVVKRGILTPYWG